MGVDVLHTFAALVDSSSAHKVDDGAEQSVGLCTTVLSPVLSLSAVSVCLQRVLCS